MNEVEIYLANPTPKIFARTLLWVWTHNLWALDRVAPEEEKEIVSSIDSVSARVLTGWRARNT